MCGEQLHLLPWKIIPNFVLIITCSLGQVHMELLYFANSILNVSDISDNIVGISTYGCLYDNISDIFRKYFQRKVDVHDQKLRNTNNLYIYDLISENSALKLQEQIVKLSSIEAFLTEIKGYF